QFFEWEHHLRSSRVSPVGSGYFLDPVKGHEANCVCSTIHQEAAATGAEDVFVHQLLQGQVCRDGDALSTHGLGSRVARQQTLKDHLVHLRRGCTVKEPADKGNPKPAAKIA